MRACRFIFKKLRGMRELRRNRLISCAAIRSKVCAGLLRKARRFGEAQAAAPKALVFAERLAFVASRIRRLVSLGRMPQDQVQHAVVGVIGDGKIHSCRKLGIAQRGTV